MKLIFLSYKTILFVAALMLLLTHQNLRSLTPAGQSVRQDSSAVSNTVGRLSGPESVRFEDEQAFNFYTTPFHSLSATIKGEIQFSENFQDIITISPGGHFIIKERRLFTTEMLEVTAGSDGKPHFRYRLRGRQFDYDDDARAWVGQVLPEVLERSGILAESRIREHIGNADITAALAEVARLNSNHLKGKYYQFLAGYESLSEADRIELIRNAGQEITSSSELRLTLGNLLEEMPDTPEINQALLGSAGNISSSSEKSLAIRTLAQSRTIDPETAVVMAGVIQSIASSSEKSLALRAMAAHCAADHQALIAYLSAAETIASSSENALALLALIKAKDAGVTGWGDIMESAASISSSSEHSRVLRSAAQACPSQLAIWEVYFDAAGQISSSSEKARALQVAIQRDDFSGDFLPAAYPAITSISSSSEKARVLYSAAGIVLPVDKAIDAFLDAAATVSSSSELERVLVELLDRETLPGSVLNTIEAFSKQNLHSSSGNERVQRLVRERLDAVEE